MWFCVLFFHRLSAGSFIYLNDGSGNFGNLNMNGELMFSVSSGYIFYVFFMIVSFFLIVETHEKVCSCVLKNSPSFFLFVFPSLFLLVSLDIKGMIHFLFVTHKTAPLFANIAEDRPTVCKHCGRWPKLFVIIAKH